MNLMRIYIKSYFQRNNHPYSSIFPTLEFPPANSNSREQARSIKYAADGVTIPPRRYMTYLDAALAFAQCGFEMECEHVRPQDDVSQMYEDTIKMLRSLFNSSTTTPAIRKRNYIRDQLCKLKFQKEKN